MNARGPEFFDILTGLHEERNTIAGKYPKLRALLERACKDLTATENIQFSNLFSRLSYVCEKTQLDKQLTFRINTLRIHANKVLQTGLAPDAEDYLQDLKALAQVLSHFYNLPVPAELEALLPAATTVYMARHREKGEKERIRVEVSRTDADFIYVFDEESATEEPIRVRYGVPGVNEAFNATVAALWKGCQLNLLEVTVEEDGTYVPRLIILEPDYLIDISSLAECMKEHGRHPLNYLMSRLEPVKNTRHLLLGNAANLFLDELVNEKPEAPVTYASAMKAVFRAAPFEFSTCTDLNTSEGAGAFFADTKVQFDNIRKVVDRVFPEMHIDREKAVLEPSFICEQLGVQGRLDFLQVEKHDGKQFVIELKSGKAPFPDTRFDLIGVNHEAQAFIYQMVVQKVLGVPFSDHFQTFILYSKYTNAAANLRLSKASMAAVSDILNIRNGIVANERCIAGDPTELEARRIICSIRPDVLITNTHVRQQFLDNYIVPQINHFTDFFRNAKPLELDYFYSFYTFVTREHYISKAGDTEYDGRRGISSLWRCEAEEKSEAGEILTDLTILDNSTATDPPAIRLSIPAFDREFLPNFRQGDIVVLYERNHPEDNVTNKQVFKGSIESLTPTEITIRIRHRQRNPAVLPAAGKYAVEHDFLDSSYNTMYRGLYAFLQAGQDRKDLLLHQRPPAYDTTRRLNGRYVSPEINEIVLKAKQADDYFLLIGPPGTGKTSRALRSMVEEFYSEPGTNILLLSYTNRAVDEICGALETAAGNPPYIRIGSGLSCEARHRGRLLDVVTGDCQTREQVRARIGEHRIFVGTVAAVSGKMELFSLKHFQVAIIDEASQILEPALLGILSAKNGAGGNAIGKFILIGDHKQLPAVVLQNDVHTVVNNPALGNIGLLNRKESLFERLHRLHKADKQSPLWGMLHRQGRMHPEVALFSNEAFYNGELQVVPLPHQTDRLPWSAAPGNSPLHRLVATKRLVFIPSTRHGADKSAKTNTWEARIAAQLVKGIFELHTANGCAFSPAKAIGIITPYRSQIALIRKALHQLGIPGLDEVMVDTVERYQGSERDIIIYSFSINRFYQLDFLANTMMDDGQMIDRKLNVAITRARKQLFVTGNPALLADNVTYARFMAFIRSRQGYVDATPEDFLAGNF